MSFFQDRLSDLGLVSEAAPAPVAPAATAAQFSERQSAVQSSAEAGDDDDGNPAPNPPMVQQ